MEWHISKLNPPVVSEKTAGKLDKLDNAIPKIYTSYNALFSVLDDEKKWEEIAGVFFLKKEWKTKVQSNVDFLDQMPADLEDGIFYITLEEEVSFVRHITRAMLLEYLIVMEDWIKRQESNLWDLGGFKDKIKERLEEIQEETETQKETETKSSMLPSTKDLEPEERRYLLKKINEYEDIRFPQHTKKVIAAVVSGQTTIKGIMNITDISNRGTVYGYLKSYSDAKWIISRKDPTKKVKKIYSFNLETIMADLGIISLRDEEGDN